MIDQPGQGRQRHGSQMLILLMELLDGVYELI